MIIFIYVIMIVAPLLHDNPIIAVISTLNLLSLSSFSTLLL